MEIEIKFFDNTIKDSFEPEYKTNGAAAIDVRACLDRAYRLMPQGEMMIPLGFAVHMEEQNMAALLLPRSGLAYKEGLVLKNSIGLIDSDYQQQIYMAAYNLNAKKEILLRPYERIGQLMFIPMIRARFKKVDEFTTLTTRGGFGSTGKS